MVVKLETVSALYADVYPGCAKMRGRTDTIQCIIPECAKRQKQRPKSMPALIEDDAEPVEAFELSNLPRRPFVPQFNRQQSLSPIRKEHRRRQVLPSLSEDEEP